MKSSVLVETDQPLLGSEAVAVRQLVNDDRKNLDVNETLEARFKKTEEESHRHRDRLLGGSSDKHQYRRLDGSQFRNHHFF